MSVKGARLLRVGYAATSQHPTAMPSAKMDIMRGTQWASHPSRVARQRLPRYLHDRIFVSNQASELTARAITQGLGAERNVCFE